MLKIKFRNGWDQVADTVKTCLALHNIKAHEDIVREYMFEMNETDWNDMLREKQEEFLGEKIIPLLNQVFKIKC